MRRRWPTNTRYPKQMNECFLILLVAIAVLGIVLPYFDDR